MRNPHFQVKEENMKSKNMRSGRNWRVLGLLLALAAVMIGNSQSLLPAQAQEPRQPQPPPKPVIPKLPQTLDDLFAGVARQVPMFGGMFLSSDEQTLHVYLLHPSPRKVKAVEGAIAQVFGRQTIPKGGIKALKGQYGFLQLRRWYGRMAGPVLSLKGVSVTDIDEGKNRLRIGIETKDIERLVVEQLARLGIPREVVVIDVTRVIVTASRPEGGVQPASHTLHDKVRPTEGGYQIIPDNGFGGAYNLAFNATRAGVAGFVTTSWATATVWQPDGMSFFQRGPFDVAGAETVDPPGFLSPGFPCPKYTRCRYSFSAFVAYNSGVSATQAAIGRTTGLTTTSTPNITVDHNTKFAIAGQPSLPYWIGYTLNKVGRKTGWTNGKIVSTCQDWSFPPNNLALCQYSVENRDTPMIGDITDFGAPVFRLRNFSSQGWEHVELYGMLWGLVYPPPFKIFVFSPIGGVPFQQTGILSPTDLGPLGYVSCEVPPGQIPSC